MSAAPRILFVTYGGGHVGMVLPVIRELEALLPGVDCQLMALTTGHLKARAVRPTLGYKDFLHLVDADAVRSWGERLSEGNTSPDVPADETIAYLGINYLDLIAQHGEVGAADLYREQGRYGFRPLHFMRRVIDAVQPDVHLVASLVSLSRAIPAGTKETARRVVRQVVDALMKRLEEPLRSAVTGALDRSTRNRRPRHSEIDWHRTLRANLRHWQPELRTVIPERLHGHGRKSRRPQREVILCIDQSGSMAASVVYSSIFGAVLASLPAVSTKLVVFDTEVVDLSDQLDDPVELLFGVQLGGGTDIGQAVAYCQGLIRDPRNTIFVLISDLIEGGVEQRLLQRAAELVGSGVQCVALLALSDEGAPSYDRQIAAKLAGLGVPSFACTPDAFPGLMAAAIRREDVAGWAAQQGLVTSRA